MLDLSSSLAVIRYCTGVDLESYRYMLMAHGFECQPIETRHVFAVPRHIPMLFLITPSWWRERNHEQQMELLRNMERPYSSTILTGSTTDEIPPDLEARGVISAWLDLPIGAQALRSAVQSALRSIRLRVELTETQRELQQRLHEMQEMHRVGIALSAEKDLETLQQLILRTSRQVTSADAGTLYLVEENADKEKMLVFHVSQNDSVEAPYQRLSIPLDTKSIAGFVASTGQILRLDDVYELPLGAPYNFNQSMDQTFGYRTRSMLVVPMASHEGAIVGVIQLINRKHGGRTGLLGAGQDADEVEPFTPENEHLLASFASQAAIALENNLLLDSIQRLFKGFVDASVRAIEARDPSTFGHSDRVAKLTEGIADAINDIHVGYWQDIHFTPDQLVEIRYAALLHDFGKVGVPENILVKPKKLYDWKLQEIRARFQLARNLIENHYTQRKLTTILMRGREAYDAEAVDLNETCARELTDLDEALQIVLQANEPSILEEERFQMLMQVATRFVLTPEGEVVRLVADDELRTLSIRRGSLDEMERKEIERHVSLSYDFLIQIPWTKELKNVPDIAYAHHEKLNGTGYPRGLRAPAIPIQAKMMTVADIFDALTAADRPYKAAVPLQRALEILGYEARDGTIDGDLLDIFLQREVYRVVSLERASPPVPIIAVKSAS
jgi:HD-GYP domain-containing protein (c-di-GMP phosphodiesterase class II)